MTRTEQEIVVKVTADMRGILAAFDVVIEEMTAVRERLQTRFDLLAASGGVGTQGTESTKGVK